MLRQPESSLSAGYQRLTMISALPKSIKVLIDLVSGGCRPADLAGVRCPATFHVTRSGSRVQTKDLTIVWSVARSDRWHPRHRGCRALGWFGRLSLRTCVVSPYGQRKRTRLAVEASNREAVSVITDFRIVHNGLSRTLCRIRWGTGYQLDSSTPAMVRLPRRSTRYRPCIRRSIGGTASASAMRSLLR